LEARRLESATAGGHPGIHKSTSPSIRLQGTPDLGRRSSAVHDIEWALPTLKRRSRVEIANRKAVMESGATDCLAGHAT
jgi:hypothetical protein